MKNVHHSKEENGIYFTCDGFTEAGRLTERKEVLQNSCKLDNYAVNQTIKRQFTQKYWKVRGIKALSLDFEPLSLRTGWMDVEYHRYFLYSSTYNQETTAEDSQMFANGNGRWPFSWPHLRMWLSSNQSCSSLYRGSARRFVWKANTRDSLKMTHILHMAEGTAGEGTTFWPRATLTWG